MAKENGKILGYCSVKKGEQENYVNALYVSPDEQGKGIGQKLMSQALEWLGSDKPVGLGVAAYNTQAINFYGKLGFKQSDEPAEPVPPLPSGKVLPTIKMVKQAQRFPPSAG